MENNCKQNKKIVFAFAICVLLLISTIPVFAATSATSHYVRIQFAPSFGTAQYFDLQINSQTEKFQLKNPGSSTWTDGTGSYNLNSINSNAAPNSDLAKIHDLVVTANTQSNPVSYFESNLPALINTPNKAGTLLEKFGTTVSNIQIVDSNDKNIAGDFFGNNDPIVDTQTLSLLNTALAYTPPPVTTSNTQIEKTTTSSATPTFSPDAITYIDKSGSSFKIGTDGLVYWQTFSSNNYNWVRSAFNAPDLLNTAHFTPSTTSPPPASSQTSVTASPDQGAPQTPEQKAAAAIAAANAHQKNLPVQPANQQSPGIKTDAGTFLGDRYVLLPTGVIYDTKLSENLDPAVISQALKDTGAPSPQALLDDKQYSFSATANGYTANAKDKSPITATIDPTYGLVSTVPGKDSKGYAITTYNIPSSGATIASAADGSYTYSINGGSQVKIDPASSDGFTGNSYLNMIPIAKTAANLGLTQIEEDTKLSTYTGSNGATTISLNLGKTNSIPVVTASQSLSSKELLSNTQSTYTILNHDQYDAKGNLVTSSEYSSTSSIDTSSLNDKNQADFEAQLVSLVKANGGTIGGNTVQTDANGNIRTDAQGNKIVAGIFSATKDSAGVVTVKDQSNNPNNPTQYVLSTQIGDAPATIVSFDKATGKNVVVTTPNADGKANSDGSMTTSTPLPVGYKVVGDHISCSGKVCGTATPDITAAIQTANAQITTQIYAQIDEKERKSVAASVAIEHGRTSTQQAYDALQLLSSYAQGFSGYTSLFSRNAAIQKWQLAVNKAFESFTTSGWVQAICSAKFKQPPQQTAFVKIPGNSITPAATVAAQCSPAIDSFTGGNLREYKFTVFVSNPQSTNSDTPMHFKIDVYGADGSAKNIFSNSTQTTIGDQQVDLKNGVMTLQRGQSFTLPTSLRPLFSNNTYTKICIDFSEPPEFFKTSTVCNAVKCDEAVASSGYDQAPDVSNLYLTAKINQTSTASVQNNETFSVLNADI